MDVGNFVHPEIELSDDYAAKYFIDEDGVLNWINPVCPHCKSNKVSKSGLYSKNIISEDFIGSIDMRGYKCKKCNRKFITDLGDQFDYKSHFPNSLKYKSCQVKKLN